MAFNPLANSSTHSDSTTTTALTDTDIQRYQDSIQRGLGWVDQNPRDIAGFQQLVLDYLQRAFQLDPKLSAVNKKIEPATPQEVADLQIYRRIGYPNELPASLPLSGSPPVEQMMMAAVHCDHIPMFAGFDVLLRNEVRAGGYDTSHAGFALQLMKENGCFVGGDDDLRRDVAERMAGIVPTASASEDLRYECIAFLMYMGRRDLVQRAWIEQIVNEQLHDGHWQVPDPRGPYHTEGNPGNDHTTVLALWSLLQYSHPNGVTEPMLRRPTK